MITPSSLAIILQGAPFPGAIVAVTPGGAALDLAIGDETITFCEGAWLAAERRTTPAHLSFAATPTAEQVHTEIRRVLAIVNAPADDPLYDRATAAQALAKVTAERDALIVAESDLSKIAAALAIPALEPHDDALSMVRRLVDGYTVVSQRLVGSQKEVAERDTTIDELRSALEVIAGHVGADGSDQWAVEVIKAKVGEVAARAEKVEHRLRRDDELREQIAVAVGLDGSASLALILDTVTRDRPGREIARLSGLLDVLAAPVTFGERRLSTVERAEWALRRALRERDEVAPRMAQLIDAEVCLDVLGVPAYAAVPGDEPGDASEALTVAERLRLYFGAHKDP